MINILSFFYRFFLLLVAFLMEKQVTNRKYAEWLFNQLFN